MNIVRDIEYCEDMVSSSLPNQSFHRCKAIITLFVRGGREALYCDHRISTAIHPTDKRQFHTQCVFLFGTNLVLETRMCVIQYSYNIQYEANLIGQLTKNGSVFHLLLHASMILTPDNKWFHWNLWF